MKKKSNINKIENTSNEEDQKILSNLLKSSLKWCLTILINLKEKTKNNGTNTLRMKKEVQIQIYGKNTENFTNSLYL